MISLSGTYILRPLRNESQVSTELPFFHFRIRFGYFQFIGSSVTGKVGRKSGKYTLHIMLVYLCLYFEVRSNNLADMFSYMEMAAAVCAVVNGGRLMQPYLVSDILNPDGSILQHTEPVCRRQVIKPETSETMREMMEAVVLYGGGRNARIQGYRVGGKSGTSQKLDSTDEKARIASFVAVAPIDDPQFLCLVCLDEPHSWTTAGGSLSAPVCAEVLEQTLVYKGVPRAVGPETDPDPAQTAADLPADGDSFDGA